MIHDRLINGAIAGSVGAVIQNGYAQIIRMFGYSGPFYIDYGKGLLFCNKQYQGLLPNGLGLVAHFIWDMVLAILFAYLLQRTSSRYHWLKGMIYGVTVWLFIRTGATLYRIPLICEAQPYTVVFFLGGAVLFGFIITVILKLMDQSNFSV